MPAPTYDLPWNRHDVGADDSDASSSADNSPVGARGSSSSFASASGMASTTSAGGAPLSSGFSAPDDAIDDSLLLDAEALIGNAMKMGIKNQILPRAPKRISILDIADLQIVDVASDAGPGRSSTPQSRSSSLSQHQQRHFDSVSSDRDTRTLSQSDSVASSSAVALDSGESIDDALERFDRSDSDASALKTQYTAIFCALQRELSDAKRRIAVLTQRLDDKSEENAAFRSDIETLQTALTAVHVADKVNELVAGDLAQLVQTTQAAAAAAPSSNGALKPLPENYY